MGYEIKIYVGEVPSFEKNEPKWFNVIGMVDICKPGYESQIYKLAVDKESWTFQQKVYFYGSDGNTQINKDKYGEELKTFPIDIVIAALEKDIKANYRRFNIALDFLKSIKENWKDQEVSVILFGY